MRDGVGVGVEIGEELVGRRVSLRFRIGDRDGRPLHRDAVGELSVDGPGAVLVATRRGPVRVERSAVVAVRAVPPPPPRRAALAAIIRLEGLCADAWPAVVDRPLGGWRLRAAGGWTGRANSALAIGDPGLPITAALDAVRTFAQEQRVPARVQVPVGSPWDRAVAARGWVLDAGHEAGALVAVLVGALDPDPVPDRGDVRRVELADRPPDGWWELAFGGPPSPAQRHVVDPSRPPSTFALVRGPDGAALAQLRATVVEDHLHLSLLKVVAEQRRRGRASALLAAVTGWGVARGARWSVLQVATHNAGALAFYRRLGHVEHHRYRYLVPPT